ncbi:hypothetical protein Tco_1469662 [Tanacetum coccineum]
MTGTTQKGDRFMHHGFDHRIRKLKMPLFDGEDAYGWIYKVERYFEIQGIPQPEQLRAAVLCMEGEDLSCESSDDEEDAEEDGSQFGDKVITDNNVERRKDSGDDLKYSPCFTPSVINMEKVNKNVKEATSNEVNEHVNSTSNKLEESVPKGKFSLNNSVCSKGVHTCGSILQLMDELVKETKMESMEIVTP